MPRHPAIATTTETLTTSVYSDLAKRAQASGKKVYPLHVGDTYRLPPKGAWAENQRIAEHANLHNYSPTPGLPALREAIASRWSSRSQRDLDAAQVQVTAGATNGLSVAIQSLVEPGEDVLVLAPFWPLIRGMIAARGANPVQVPFFTELDRPGFDVAETLGEHLTARTVALYVNTPNNPTGRVLDEVTMAALVAFAREHGLWLLCDEAYEDLFLTDTRPRALWDMEGAESIAIAAHTFSKSYALAGARVGFLHGPAQPMQTIASVQTYQNYCAPRPMQEAVIAAIQGGDAWQVEARAAYRQAGEKLAASFGVEPPQGGTFLFFDATPFLRSGEELVDFLGRCCDEGILMTGGGACGAAYPGHVRVCFTSVSPQDLDEVIGLLPALLSK